MKLLARLAADTIRKNRRLYLPYLLTLALMICIYYILSALTEAEFVLAMRGGSDLKFVLNFGSWVIALFALLFLFYTNAFLIRSRKKEFGLYSVLGMSRGDILKLYFYETLMIYFLTLIAGLVSGILFSKFCELLLIRLIHGEVGYGFTISWQVLGKTALVFGLIELILFFCSAVEIQKESAASLLKSENYGEKPPKSNAALGIIGVVILAAAYTMAASIQHPVEALFIFFIAVLLVILATYILFIAGSVWLCGLLQKRKEFYYRPENYITVSTMRYRMKRNGAGLASICILLTMVLVMISSSACLYFGKDQALRNRTGRDILVNLNKPGWSPEDPETAKELLDAIDQGKDGYQIKDGSLAKYYEYCIGGFREDNGVDFTISADIRMNISDYARITKVHLMSLDTYNRLNGIKEELGEEEVLLYDPGNQFPGEILVLGPLNLKVCKRLPQMSGAIASAATASITADIFVITKKLDDTVKALLEYKDLKGNSAVYLHLVYQFDTKAKGVEAQEEILEKIDGNITPVIKAMPEKITWYASCYEVDKADFYSTFGGLFFIGLILSLVFLVATALIIYYRQITEGYEDRARFEIMQKVGMTKEDIRRSIRSQMKTVFLFPLGMAVLHLAFAFPLIFKSLMLFGVSDLKLYLTTTLISILFCALFYGICYRTTQEGYYRIVSGD